MLRIKLKEDPEIIIERDQYEVATVGVVYQGTLYPPEMIESVEEVER